MSLPMKIYAYGYLNAEVTVFVGVPEKFVLLRMAKGMGAGVFVAVIVYVFPMKGDNYSWRGQQADPNFRFG